MRQQVLRMEQELLHAESGGGASAESNPAATASSPATAPTATATPAAAATAAAMGAPATAGGAKPATPGAPAEGAVHMDTGDGVEHGGGDEDPDARSIYVGNVCTPPPPLSFFLSSPRMLRSLTRTFKLDRSTMALRQKRSKPTFPRAGLSTA